MRQPEAKASRRLDQVQRPAVAAGVRVDAPAGRRTAGLLEPPEELRCIARCRSAYEVEDTHRGLSQSRAYSRRSFTRSVLG